MKKTDVIFERKEFLNLAGHNGMANIVTQIIKSPWGDDDELNRSIDVKLDFADCSRVISMDIETHDDYSRENSIHKVDVLIDVLSEFREALVKELKYQARLEKKIARKKAEEEVKEKEKD